MPNRVLPQDAAKLLAEGYTYVDVRSVPEYEQGHPKGAKNVPFMNFENGRMVLNPQFLQVMEQAFPKDTKMVIGCKAGGRSLKAAELLERAGWKNLVDMRGGYDAEMGPTGEVVVPGWSRAGLPTETQTPGGSYAEIKK